MDVVVTVPKQLWTAWCQEGDLPGQPWSGEEWAFYLGGAIPDISPGERVYIAAYGLLRGYAPLVRVEYGQRCCGLIRQGGGVAVTIDEPIRGFRGFRYRWWDESAERPYDFARGPEAIAEATS